MVEVTSYLAPLTNASGLGGIIAENPITGLSMLASTRIPLGVLCSFALMLQSASPAKPVRARIAFASHRDGNWEIYVTDGDGAHQTRLTRRDAQDRFPLWSPDLTKIAFGSQLPNDWDLWVMNADGSQSRRLCSHIVAKGFRQWSPDGRRIALAA